MYNQYFYGLGSAKSCIRELFEYGLQDVYKRQACI